MTISVIVPTYNRGPRVQKTLDAILAQTLAPLEILVIDDGSTDGTAAWIAAHYGALVRVETRANGGVASARNAGLELARGDYVAFCDHDDQWLPHKLECQAQVARAHPEAALVGCNWADTDEDGAPWDGAAWRAAFANWHPARGEVYDWLCAMPCPIVSMTLPLIHAAKLRAIGGFDAACAPCDDWDLYLRLAHRFPFEWADQTLANYVHHDEQQSSDALKLAAAMHRVLARQWPAILKHPRSLGFWWSFGQFTASAPAYYRAKSRLQDGRAGAVWREIARLLLRQPLAVGTKQWLYLTLRLLRRQFDAY